MPIFALVPFFECLGFSIWRLAMQSPDSLRIWKQNLWGWWRGRCRFNDKWTPPPCKADRKTLHTLSRQIWKTMKAYLNYMGTKSEFFLESTPRILPGRGVRACHHRSTVPTCAWPRGWWAFSWWAPIGFEISSLSRLGPGAQKQGNEWAVFVDVSADELWCRHASYRLKGGF